MGKRSIRAWALGVLALAACAAGARAESTSEGANAIVISFTDGQQQSFAAADVARLELHPPAAIVFRDGHRQKIDREITRIEFRTEVPMVGQNHFLGRWKCGDGAGGTFFITLERNGAARKSVGDVGGTWKLVDGEAHISWDDGWKDIIRRTGSKHEKVAFRPGMSFSDEPSNVTTAKSETAEPI